MPRILINVASIRKLADASFTSQIIVTDKDDNKSFYACRLDQNGSLNSKNIYEFINGKWILSALDDHLVSSIKSRLVGVIHRTRFLYKRTIPSANKDARFAMFKDAVIDVGSAVKGHVLKIDDRVFTTHNAMDITPNGSDTKLIKFEMLGAPEIKGTIDISNDKALFDRIKAQFDFASKLHSRVINSRPVGGGSWASHQNDRKLFGRSTMDHRKLQRSRS